LSLELEVSSITDSIELDEGTEDNRFSKLVTAFISNDIAEGTYPISINAYYDGKLSDSDTVSLAVLACERVKEVKEDVKEAKPKVEVIIPEPIVEERLEVPIEISFADTDEYLTLLAILVIVFIGTVIFVVGAAFIVLRK